MRVRNLGDLFRQEVESAEIVAPERTGLYATACDNLTMSRAYLSDGDSFCSSGDPVNALAAYFYGEGWLHCGAACGFLTVATPRCLFRSPSESLPMDVLKKLTEKTNRYSRLLATARAAVRPAPEAATPMYATAERVMIITETYACQGRVFLARRNLEPALACFSYGHGWLDAGVRAGLFRVTSDRDLFTI